MLAKFNFEQFHNFQFGKKRKEKKRKPDKRKISLMLSPAAGLFLSPKN